MAKSTIIIKVNLIASEAVYSRISTMTWVSQGCDPGQDDILYCFQKPHQYHLAGLCAYQEPMTTRVPLSTVLWHVVGDAPAKLACTPSLSHEYGL